MSGGARWFETMVEMTGYQVMPVGHVESPLTDRAQAPRQGDEGAPSAWLVFRPEVADAVRDLAAGNSPVGEQMTAALRSTYIAYSGPCVADETAGSLTLKVEAAWRPDYVGTEQKRFFRFENGKMLFGPAQGSIRAGSDQLTRRLTLERP